MYFSMSTVLVARENHTPFQGADDSSLIWNLSNPEIFYFTLTLYCHNDPTSDTLLAKFGRILLYLTDDAVAKLYVT